MALLKKHFYILVISLLFSPYLHALTIYNSFEFQFINQTEDTLTIEGFELNQGNWSQGKQPQQGTQYAKDETIGGFATESSTVNMGNGGTMYLSGRQGRSITITWFMPWSGQVVYSAHSEGENAYIVNDERIETLGSISHKKWAFIVNSNSMQIP